MSHVTSSQANPSAPAPPTEAQQVTLEISDRLSIHLLYKYSMCTKDNLACEAGREKEAVRQKKGLSFEYSELNCGCMACWPAKVTFESVVNI